MHSLPCVSTGLKKCFLSGIGRCLRYEFTDSFVSKSLMMRPLSCRSATTPRQLDSLVAQLGLTEPHYIKCIKPNSAKAPSGWSCPLVMEQLRYSGVLEVSKLRGFLCE